MGGAFTSTASSLAKSVVAWNGQNLNPLKYVLNPNKIIGPTCSTNAGNCQFSQVATVAALAPVQYELVSGLPVSSKYPLYIGGNFLDVENDITSQAARMGQFQINTAASLSSPAGNVLPINHEDNSGVINSIVGQPTWVSAMSIHYNSPNNYIIYTGGQFNQLRLGATTEPVTSNVGALHINPSSFWQYYILREVSSSGQNVKTILDVFGSIYIGGTLGVAPPQNIKILPDYTPGTLDSEVKSLSLCNAFTIAGGAFLNSTTGDPIVPNPNPAKHVAFFGSGGTWHTVGNGLGDNDYSESVNALACDGGNNILYAGGAFGEQDNMAYCSVATDNNGNIICTNWAALGRGVTDAGSTVNALLITNSLTLQ